MDQTSREFQVFIKPVGAICNLRCSYCYYLSRKELYPAEAFPRMKEELLEEYIRQQFDATTDDTLFFSWHGGTHPSRTRILQEGSRPSEKNASAGETVAQRYPDQRNPLRRSLVPIFSP